MPLTSSVEGQMASSKTSVLAKMIKYVCTVHVKKSFWTNRLIDLGTWRSQEEANQTLYSIKFRILIKCQCIICTKIINNSLIISRTLFKSF